MNNLIITGLLAGGLLVIFYRFAVRPLLRSAFIERIEVQEERLSKMVADGKLNREDFTYQFLAQKFQVKNHLGHIGFSGFLHFLICRDRNAKDPMEIKKFAEEASAELREIHHVLCRDVLRWMFVNSPSYCLLGAIIICFVMIFKSMDEKKVRDEAFIFADLEAQGCRL